VPVRASVLLVALTSLQFRIAHINLVSACL